VSGQSPSTHSARVAGLFDRAADLYESTGVEFFAVFGRWLVEAAALKPGERVFDVGSGRGAVTIPAATAVTARGHVVARDLAPRMVELLSADVAARGLTNVDVGIDDAQSPSFEPESFDCVLAGLMVFLLPDPLAALQTWRGLLRPDGRLAISTFGVDDERWRWTGDLWEFAPAEQRPAGNDLVDRRWRTAAHVREVVEGAGYRDVSSHDRELLVRFRDVEQWDAWSHSQGQRAMWERIPPERHDDVRRVAAEHMEAIRDADGTVPMRSTLRITTARR
jgi:SAM-dependent methyltransferase